MRSGDDVGEQQQVNDRYDNEMKFFSRKLAMPMLVKDKITYLS
jgi:hypothetical protein